MRFIPSFIFLTLLSFTTGCDFFRPSEERVVIAKVKKHQLYLDELLAALPDDLSAEDSALMADSHIKQWATRMLLMDKAELNLSDKEKDVRAQLEEYRSSLIIYLYEKQLVQQRLDTTLTDLQIEEYYNNNMQNFELQVDIARALFIKLDKNSKDVEKVRALCQSNKEEKRQELEQYCVQHAKAYHLNDQQWVAIDELLNQLPRSSVADVSYRSLYNFAQTQDSTSIYLLGIKEMKHKNSISPLEFEKQNIRNILLNQRKLELIQKLEKDIFDEAVSKDQFEILTN